MTLGAQYAAVLQRIVAAQGRRSSVIVLWTTTPESLGADLAFAPGALPRGFTGFFAEFGAIRSH